MSATVRVKDSAGQAMVDGSGEHGLLIKDFSTSGSVEWLKPKDGESGPDFLARSRQYALDQRRPGLAFSASGSIGIRRPAGYVRATFSISGLLRGTTDDQIATVLADEHWTEVFVQDLRPAGKRLRATFKAIPPSTGPTGPWQYTMANGQELRIEAYHPFKKLQPLKTLDGKHHTLRFEDELDLTGTSA